MTGPALLALGATGSFCAVTFVMSLFDLAPEAATDTTPSDLTPDPATSARVLALVPPGAAFLVEGTEEALPYARALHGLLHGNGRLPQEPEVLVVRGMRGSGFIHSASQGLHCLLVLGPPGPESARAYDA